MRVKLRTWMYNLLILIAAVQLPGAQADSSDQDSKAIEVMTIINSGFWSGDTVVIKYNMREFRIVSITKNGEEVPESEYSKYEADLYTAQESAELREIMPRVYDLEKRLDSPDIPDSVKLAELIEVLRVLWPMKSEYAETYADELESRQWRLFRPYLMADIRAELDRSGFTPTWGFKELTIGSEHCLIDDVQLSEELATAIRKIFRKHRGVALGEDEQVIYIFNKDKESPDIRRRISKEN